MTNNYLQPFTQKVEGLTSLGKAKIAFGLKEPNQKILDSLTKAKKYADITLVGNETIKDVEGFAKIIVDNPEEKLATMLANDEIEGIIRGTIDDFQTKEVYEKLTGEKYAFAPAIMETPNGHQFLLGPASNPEGWDKEERLAIAEGFAEFFKTYGIEPDIAIFTGRRHETYPRNKDKREGVDGILNKTYEDAEWIVEQLNNKGYKAKNWAIDLNPALEAGANVIVPVNGMVGNQIFRAMHFAGGRLLTCTRLGYSRPYEDNSRTETDYEFHVKWLVAMVNQKKFNQ